MHRVDSPGAVDGQFQDGNPAVGQQATMATSDWHNDVQENLCYLIEQVDIALVKGDETQLYAAVVALVAGVVGDGSGAVPTTRQVLGGGLATGGGPLANDVTLTVPKASSADVTAGTDDTKAITPAALAAAVGAGLTTAGYWRAPGGMIMQWGSLYVGQDSSAVATFPIVFPTACFNVQLSWVDTTLGGGSDMGSAGVTNPSINGFTLYNDGKARTHYFLAIGK